MAGIEEKRRKEKRKRKKEMSFDISFLKSGRGERIRTSDFHVPNVTLYQAESHPELRRIAVFKN